MRQWEYLAACKDRYVAARAVSPMASKRQVPPLFVSKCLGNPNHSDDDMGGKHGTQDPE